MTEKERILFAAVKGIQALAYDNSKSAKMILDRIRITCHQTLEIVE